MKLKSYKIIFSFLVCLGLFFSFGNVSLAAHFGDGCTTIGSSCGSDGANELFCIKDTDGQLRCISKTDPNAQKNTATTETKKPKDIAFTPQIPFGDIKGTMPVNGGTIGFYITEIYKYAVGIVSILASIVIMWGGVRWLTAGGNQEAVGDAKKWIEGALSGLVLVMTSYLILNFVNPDLTSFKLITITPIEGVKSETATAQEVIAKNTSGGGIGIYAPPNNVTSYDTTLRKYATKHGVDYQLLKAIMLTESAGNPNARSGVGAVGLMQVMPTTAAPYLGNRNLNEPEVNIDVGAQYLSTLYKRACNGRSSTKDCNVSDNDFIIASYNGGPGSNRSSDRCPDQTWWECEKNNGYQQTREYVARVKTNLENVKQWQ